MFGSGLECGSASKYPFLNHSGEVSLANLYFSTAALLLVSRLQTCETQSFNSTFLLLLTPSSLVPHAQVRFPPSCCLLALNHSVASLGPASGPGLIHPVTRERPPQHFTNPGFQQYFCLILLHPRHTLHPTSSWDLRNQDLDFNVKCTSEKATMNSLYAHFHPFNSFIQCCIQTTSHCPSQDG